MGVNGLFFARVTNGEPARHPEMGDHRLAVVEWRGQELPPATDPFDEPALETLIQLAWATVVSGGPGVRSPDEGQSMPGHGLVEMTAGDLNFGQLRHTRLHVEGELPYRHSCR
jgi:hypothetical protein